MTRRMSADSSGRKHESVVNAALADLFQKRAGLQAEAESTHSSSGRPDVLVLVDNGPIVVETEYAPARSVNADALARLGMEIQGQAVSVAFAVSVPKDLRAVPQAQLASRLAVATLDWQEWRGDGTSGPRIRGNVDELAQAVRSAEAPVDDLDEAVDQLDEGARAAGARLFGSPATLQRVAEVFQTAPGDEAANMGALVVINAMMFHERLAEFEPGIRPVSTLRWDGRIAKNRLAASWDAILAIDYFPIFRMARDVVEELPTQLAADFLDRCALTAERLLGMAATRRHDLAGRIFNRLIADRKFLAAFYTKIPTATLLAGLALDPSQWPDVDWRSPDSVRGLTVIDPACGTGTLLMAAYHQLADNARRAGLPGNEASDQPQNQLHRLLIEDVIHGADVVQAAIHLTAATLAAMSPSVAFRRMNLHTLPLGFDDVNGARLGSLDWLTRDRLDSLFSGAGEQVSGLAGDTASSARRPRADLVIMNPPYTRHEGPGDGSDTFTTVFGAFREPGRRAATVPRPGSGLPGNAGQPAGRPGVCLHRTGRPSGASGRTHSRGAADLGSYRRRLVWDAGIAGIPLCGGVHLVGARPQTPVAVRGHRYRRSAAGSAATASRRAADRPSDLREPVAGADASDRRAGGVKRSAHSARRPARRRAADRRQSPGRRR